MSFLGFFSTLHLLQNYQILANFGQMSKHDWHVKEEEEELQF